MNELDHSKFDAKEFKEFNRALDMELSTVQTICGNHENHFAMVENFVEKYVPIRIQS